MNFQTHQGYSITLLRLCEEIGVEVQAIVNQTLCGSFVVYIKPESLSFPTLSLFVASVNWEGQNPDMLVYTAKPNVNHELVILL